MKLDDVKKLHQKKYRTQFGHYVVEGEHLILELQNAMTTQPELKQVPLFVTEEYQQWAQQLTADFNITVVSQKQMVHISDTKTPQGIIACVPLPQQKGQQSVVAGEKAIYLHEVQDPGNLGTIIRSLAWFGQFRLLLSPNSVDPFNSKVVRASMGAIFQLPIEQEVSLSDLQSRYRRFAYLDLQGAAISSQAFAEHDCYLFGNEARGVPHEALATFNAEAFTIEGKGQVESLNLGTAVGICAYQLAASSPD